MTKIGVMVVLVVILVGTALYFSGSKVSPAVGSKGNSINTSVSGAGVNVTNGTVTMTAP